jgi:peptidoglycan/LPS O-acetylase OafA/YrhL
MRRTALLSGPGLAYRADVDGLRAVAVIAVLTYHMHHAWLPGGFTGVDIFFVISGFVVTGSLLQQRRSATVGDFLAGFYVRRAKRLAPALMLMVLGSSIGLLAVPEAGETLDYYFMTAQLALVGAANIAFASQRTSYFTMGTATLRTELNPFTHTWSLGVEEQFYFLLPLCVLLAYRGRAAPTAVHCGRCVAFPLLSLGLAGALSFAASAGMSLTYGWGTAAFYLIPSRFWQLAAGAALYEASMRDWPASVPEMPEAARCLAWLVCELVVLLLFVVALTSTQGDVAFPVPGSLPAIVGALAYIAMGCAPRATYFGCVPRPAINALVGCAPMAYVGRISYPLYLWHWPVFVFCRWTSGLEEVGVRLGALVSTALLALASYHLVEGRVRRWRPRSRWRVFALLIATAGAIEVWLALLRGPLYGHLSGALVDANALAQKPAATPRPRVYAPVAPAVSALLSAPLSPLAPSHAMPPSSSTAVAASPPVAWPQCACRNPPDGASHVLRDPPSADPRAEDLCYDAGHCLTVDQTGVSCVLNGLSDPCFFLPPDHAIAHEVAQRVWNTTKAQECLSAAWDGDAPIGRIFLFGDSYTDSIRIAVEQIARGAGYAVVHAARACCDWGPPDEPEEDLSMYTCTCAKHNDFEELGALMLGALQDNLQPGDIVLSISHENHHLRQRAMPWYREVAMPLVESKGAKLVLAKAWPVFPIICAIFPRHSLCVTPASRSTEVDARLASLVSESESVFGVDLSLPFCSEGECTPFLLGSQHTGYAADGLHLVRDASPIMESFLCKALYEQGILSSPGVSS